MNLEQDVIQDSNLARTWKISTQSNYSCRDVVNFHILNQAALLSLIAYKKWWLLLHARDSNFNTLQELLN